MDKTICETCGEHLMLIDDPEIIGSEEHVWHVCPLEVCGCDGHTSFYTKKWFYE